MKLKPTKRNLKPKVKSKVKLSADTNGCPRCGSKNYGCGPNFDNLRWIGCYDCGYGFR